MTACVTETSYYLIFAVSLLISLMFLISCAYNFDRLRNFKEEPTRVTNGNLTRTSNITLGFFISGVIGLITLFVLFFGFQKRLLGVYTTTAVAE